MRLFWLDYTIYLTIVEQSYKEYWIMTKLLEYKFLNKYFMDKI